MKSYELVLAFLWPGCTEAVVTRNKVVIPQPLQRPAIPVGKLKQGLAQVPDDHFLVPSQVYDFFIVDKDGHNKGYISASGELYWWPVKEK
jgi:hypothetical protein